MEEALIASCNSLTQIRNAAEKNPELRLAVLDSMEPVKILPFQRLELQGKPVLADFVHGAQQEEHAPLPRPSKAGARTTRASFSLHMSEEGYCTRNVTL